MGPFGKRFEVIHRFAGLDLDDALELVPPIRRQQHDIWKHRRWAGAADGRVLFGPGIDASFVLSAKLGL